METLRNRPYFKRFVSKLLDIQWICLPTVHALFSFVEKKKGSVGVPDKECISVTILRSSEVVNFASEIAHDQMKKVVPLWGDFRSWNRQSMPTENKITFSAS